MDQLNLLRYAAGVLETMHLRYFVTGSTATILYGEVRFTNDIDIVVDLPVSQVAHFCRQFPSGQFYVSAEAAVDAVRTRGQFNIIHPESGLKIDVIIPEKTIFNQSRFARARRVEAGDDLVAYFAAPEDAIIKKLEYYQMGGSDKHLRDIAGILKISRGHVDINYINKWAATLGLAEIWEAVLRTVGPGVPGSDEKNLESGI
jgi:hypothetical protein